MKRTILFLVLLFIAGPGSTSWASTVAYWRMGDSDSFAKDGNGLPDINALTGWQTGTWFKAVNDNSGNGNHLTTWEYAWAGFNWRANVPAAKIPSTGTSNLHSIQNGGSYPAAFTWSKYSLPTGIDIEEIEPAQFTIEASFYLTGSITYRTVVGRDAASVDTSNVDDAALYFQVRPNGVAGFLFCDVSGYFHMALSNTGKIAQNKWYNMVGVSDGSTMKLYLDNVAAGKGFELVAQIDLTASGSPDTALINGKDSSEPNGADWEAGTWSVGRGLYNGGHADRWFGYIDEVRISNTALKPSQFLMQKRATEPVPSDDDAINYYTNVNIKWTPATAAKHHDVYFGSNFNDVNDANTLTSGIYKGRKDTNSYNAGTLVRGTTYYWRIDEVNDPNIWKGAIWRFLVIPSKAWSPSPYNGEFYVFTNPTLSWKKGPDSAQGKVYLGTIPGSLTYQTTINYTSGIQSYSYPVSGLNNNQYYYWRIDEVNGATTWTGDEWHFKTIPTISIDDPHRVGWWVFDEGQGKAIDWSGYGHHGTVYGDATSVPGYDANAIKFDGLNDYVSLPIGSTIASLDSATIATWVNFSGAVGSFQRIFDFGNDPNVYMFLTPRYGWTDGPLRFAITTTSWDGDPGESAADDPAGALPTGWHHVAVVIDGDYSTITLYLDAVPVAADVATNTLPSDLGSTTNNWLGRSQYSGDAYFNGLLDNFVIYDYAMTQDDIKHLMASKQASLPNPTDGATDVIRRPTLSWEPGIYAAKTNGHKLYFSDDFDDVNNRTVTPVTRTDPCYVLPSPPVPLESLGVYYWAVDEVNGSNTWKGNVWSFTVYDYSLIDNFERYTSTGYSTPNPPDPMPSFEAGSLRRTWIDGFWVAEWKTYPDGLKTPGSSGSYAQLNTDTYDDDTNGDDIALGGTNSMKFYYDNDGTITWLLDLYGEDAYYTYTAPKYSEVSAAIDDAARLTSPNPPFDPEAQSSLGIDRDLSGYKLMRVPVYGDPNNTLAAGEKLYVGLRDGDGTEVTIYNSDPNIIKQAGWHYWYILMKDFNTPPKGSSSLNMADIARVYLGIGVRGNTTTSGGKGAVFFDNIQILTDSVCIAGSVSGDFNGDCSVDTNDLQFMTEMWMLSLSGTVTLPDANCVIRLDASTLSLGQIPASIGWLNSGTAGGAFKDFNTSDPCDNPVVKTVEGKRAVVFDGNDSLRATVTAPSSITGSSPFTIIATIWNLDIGSDEEYFCWAKRGTANRYAAVGYGSHATWGAAEHWDPPGDMGFDRGVPAAHTWHTIAVTYEGDSNAVETIVVDGLINATEVKTLDLWPSNPMTVGSAYDGDPDDTNDPTITPGYFFSGALAKLEVYNVYVPPTDLAKLMGTPVDINKDYVVNFKDLAILAKKWMTTVLWP